MIWSDTVQNTRADEEAARAVSAVFLPSEDWTGASAIATATLSWNAGGAVGPDASWQPAQVGVAYAAPEPSVSGTVSHVGLVDSGGDVFGIQQLAAPVTFSTPTAHIFRLAVGPNA